MKITHKMIADATGFTQSTVSKALNSAGRISEETAALIRKTAGEMGYYSQSRKGLRHKETHLFPQIAVLVPEITSWFYANIVEQLQQQIEWLGGAVCIYVTGFNENNVEFHIDHINRQNLFDGIVVLYRTLDSACSDIPVIVLPDNRNNAPTENTYLLYMNCGIDLAIQHLAQLGHTEIGFLGERNTQGKLHEFRRKMLSLELPLEERYIYTSNFRFERIGHDGVQAYHNRGSFPTGIICAYDEVAFGAIEELQKLHISVPQDISVIGINNIDACSFFRPVLTTLQENIPVLVQRMTEIIQTVIIEEKPCGHSFDIPAELIIRSTTAKHTSL